MVTDILLACGFVILLTLIALGLLAGGVDAIQNQRHEFRTRDHRLIMVYQGTDAISFGVGLCAGGSMLAIGVVALVRQLFLIEIAPDSLDHFSWVSCLMAWAAFVCLVVAAFGIFPPWRLSSAAFFGTVLVLAVFDLAFSRAARRRIGGYPHFCLFGAALFCMSFSGTACVAILLATFAYLCGLVMLATAIPRVERWLME